MHHQRINCSNSTRTARRHCCGFNIKEDDTNTTGISDGQYGLSPVQFSVKLLQGAPTGRNSSAGHATLLPLQNSVISHCPVAFRQMVPLTFSDLEEHVVLLFPLQTPGFSHGPLASSQIVPAGA